jgi:RimJ/RimL family protein N-acetyltransferase
VIDSQTNKIIGCSRYYVSPNQPDSISIGFTFLHHRYWGGATNSELKRLMLNHAFECFAEVWFHIAPSNIRSRKATAKLGAEHVGGRGTGPLRKLHSLDVFSPNESDLEANMP